MVNAFSNENDSVEYAKKDFFVELGDGFQYNREKACKNVEAGKWELECPDLSACKSRLWKGMVISMNSILEVSDLNESYDSFSLKNITFSLPRGCIMGLIGVNGAGKTMTLRSILEHNSSQYGSVRFFGIEPEENKRQIKNRVGIAMEDIFYDELTLFEMKCVKAPSYVSWSEQAYNRYIERFSLNPKQKIKMLSGGEQVKYALALALSRRTELLIVDEPAGGFDAADREQIFSALTEYMNNGGQGVLISLRTTFDLDKIADMLVMIDNGRIVFQEGKDALLNRYRIVRGDIADLTADTRSFFQNIKETGSGFTAITREASKIWEYMPDAVIECPTIEDIMLANTFAASAAC